MALLPFSGAPGSAIVARVDLTSQASSISTTTLYAVPATGAGVYRVACYAKVTQAASGGTPSSTLAGTGFKLAYTDGDDSVAVTSPAIPNTSGSTLTGNTTQIMYVGGFVLKAKASTNIQYTFGYTSAGTTPMQYSLHLRAERL